MRAITHALALAAILAATAAAPEGNANEGAESKEVATTPAERAEQFADWVPINFMLAKRKINGKEYNVPTFTMCKVDFAERSRDPPAYPMFHHIMGKSGCELRGSNKMQAGQKIRLSEKELTRHLDETEEAWKELNDGVSLHEPDAMIYHQARCGSTLTGNLFSARADDVVYSEPGPVPQIFRHCIAAGWPDDRMAKLVRLVVRAWGRVRGAKHMYIKWTSYINPSWHVISAAFPKVPFVYLHRHPVEVISSLLFIAKDAERQIQEGADPAKVKGKIISKGPAISCMEDIRNPREETKLVLGMDGMHASVAPPEQYCAAHLRIEDQFALNELRASRDDPSRPTGAVVDYKDMPFVLPHMMREHFGYDLGEAEERRVVVLAGSYSKNYNNRQPEGHHSEDSEFKQRTAPKSVHTWSTKYTMPMYDLLNEEFGFHTTNTTDVFRYYGEKEAEAAAAAAAAPAAKKAKAPAKKAKAPAKKGKAQAGNARRLAEVPEQPVARQLAIKEAFGQAPPTVPAEQSYPKLFPLVDILDEWNPDSLEVPESYGKYASMRIFGWDELEEAAKYRELELPFVVRGVPNVLAINKKWTDDYLTELLGSHPQRVEKFSTNRFMYYAKNHPSVRSGKVDTPAKSVHMTYSEWVEDTQRVERLVAEHGALAASEMERNYMTISSRPDDGSLATLAAYDAKSENRPTVDWAKQSKFVGRDWEIFRALPSFFVRDTRLQRGIHCRFGQPGIIAEAHWDAGRNFIAMARGRKRWILSPPSDCESLDILRSGISARHSATDWSNSTQYHKTLQNAKAFEIVLEPGDVLYCPSLWFHLPLSLTTSIQCNTRSGQPPEGVRDIRDCGFQTAGMSERKSTGGLPTPHFAMEPVPSPPPVPAAVDGSAQSVDFKPSLFKAVASVDGKSVLQHEYH